jgi:ferredoxin
MLDVELRKTTFTPVEMGYSDAQAQKEASRCLRCDVCIRCGTCEKTCVRMRVRALKFTQITTTERVLTDYPLAANTCMACGACALACPTQAIDYVEGPDYREVRLCGTVLTTWKNPIVRPGAPIPPPRYLEYVTKRSDEAMSKQVLRRLCPACSRQQRAAIVRFRRSKVLFSYPSPQRRGLGEKKLSATSITRDSPANFLQKTRAARGRPSFWDKGFTDGQNPHMKVAVKQIIILIAGAVREPPLRRMRL